MKNLNITNNWKMKCIINRNTYIKNEIYEVKDLYFIWEDGIFFDLRNLNIYTFEQYKNWSNSDWELVDDKYAEIEKYLDK